MHEWQQKLYKLDSKDKVRVWYVEVDGDTYTAYSGIDGGTLTSKATKVKGKNIGRSNETTAEEQAVAEAHSKWRKKLERELYKLDLNDKALYQQCMLALDATKVGHRIKWDENDYVAQPKLNGVRCTTVYVDDKVKLFSRKGKEYKVPHIQNQLLSLYRSMPKDKVNRELISFDGELYIHGVELGDITSAVSGNENTLKLKMNLFDLAIPKYNFSQRYKLLKYFLSQYKEKKDIELVKIFPVKDMDELKILHDNYVDDGYEGAILRDINSEYLFGKRGTGLFKYKEFQDAEFKIVAVVPDKDEKGAILVYQTETGELFNSRSTGTDEYREHQLNNPDEYIGKMGTVRFSNYLKSGVPEFGRGIAIRDYE